MKKHSYFGLDVDKESITIALAEGGRQGELREYGPVGAQTGGQVPVPLTKTHGALVEVVGVRAPR